MVLDGTCLAGGRCDYCRTLLSALILTLITTILFGRGARQALEETVCGFVILVCVGVYAPERSVSDEASARAL